LIEAKIIRDQENNEENEANLFHCSVRSVAGSMGKAH